MSLFHPTLPPHVRRPVLAERTLGARRRDVEVRFATGPRPLGERGRRAEGVTALEAVAFILDDLAVVPASLAVRTVRAGAEMPALVVTPPNREPDAAASIFTGHFAGRIVAFIPEGLSAFELELALSWFCATRADPRDIVPRPLVPEAFH